MKPTTLATIFLLSLSDSPALLGEEKLQRFEFEEKHMGTLFRFVLYAPSEGEAAKVAKEGFARVKKLNDTMSDYDPASELMRLCQKFAKEMADPVEVSPELFFVLEKARALSERSDGAFDVTVGPVVDLWRNARRTQRLPDPRELKDALARVGWAKVQLDASQRTVKLATPGMRLDLGGIAKGYAADEVLAIFQKHGVKSALVAAGGDITVSESPPGTDGWKVEIAPLPGSKEKRVLQLKNAGVSTSGDAENFVLIDGVRYSHIVDPKTGLGLTGYRSVTVIAPKGITADSTTKAAMLLPPDKALKLLDGMEGVSGLILRKVGEKEEVVKTKGFEAHLVK
jgi:thiamine biosynthesis lipoprotein